MQIFLFIVLLFAVAIMRVIPSVITKKGKETNNISTMLIAVFLSIGFGFVLPLAFNWFLNFLFGFTLDYWVAFMTILFLGIFTSSVDNDKTED